MRAGSALRKKGFTLIELMIVVAILGILAGVATGKFSDLVSKSKESRVKNSLAALRSGLSIYYSDNQFYPGDPNTSLTAGTKYLAAIPPLEIPPVQSQGNPGHPSGNSIALLLDDQSTGQWAYLFAGTTDSQFVVNCTHMDTRGLAWSAY